jgi:hypothetical protein
MKVCCTAVKKVLCSARKMNLGGSVVVLDCKRMGTQNKETGKKTRIGHEDGQRITRLWLPPKEEETKGEVEKALKGDRFAILATEIEGVFTWRV